MKIFKFIKYLWIKLIHSRFFETCLCFLILYGIPWIIFWIVSKIIGDYLAFLLFLLLSSGLIIGLYLKQYWDDFNKNNEEN